MNGTSTYSINWKNSHNNNLKYRCLINWMILHSCYRTYFDRFFVCASPSLLLPITEIDACLRLSYPWCCFSRYWLPLAYWLPLIYWLPLTTLVASRDIDCPSWYWLLLAYWLPLGILAASALNNYYAAPCLETWNDAHDIWLSEQSKITNSG